ncbi:MULTISPECIES: TetR/AcrR family transcriptional regulator [unclassified Rathayibacter]|uniref:TetR/AcrR family transcriptional regulator n=1 Tax=unclassified Rathayibacter TaxID=2609250 RepID=UPI00188A8DDF|nr:MULTISPECIES: TetR/AcrR family transcriptional regulator [unclassified Rathayibacter]MBF4462414.1 TetR/AcrR family transcriptional regulator [Rathayibacter sp. VKM Ac-2879]MBF4503543.1 TetR/AcrR family transcriptional regulator [Rathayibacter sp. VKM Ac-2878]
MTSARLASTHAAESPTAPGSGDPRARRTRRRVFDAVERLVMQSDGERAEGIAVSDIVREAGISRSSFYAHFDDAAAVASALLREDLVLADVAEPHATDQTGVLALRRGYSRLVERLVDRHAFHARLRARASARVASDDAVLATALALHREVLARVEVPSAVDSELAATFAAGGVLAVVGAWLAGSLDGTDEELVEHLLALLPSWLAEAPLATPTSSVPPRPTTKGTT